MRERPNLDTARYGEVLDWVREYLPYHVEVPIDGFDPPEVRQWCTDNIGPRIIDYTAGDQWNEGGCWDSMFGRTKKERGRVKVFGFLREADAILFKLRWVG